MVAYIIRRLFNAAITLLVVTAVTFAIFFMAPKLTGSDPALLYIGKTADARSIGSTMGDWALRAFTVGKRIKAPTACAGR